MERKYPKSGTKANERKKTQFYENASHTAHINVQMNERVNEWVHWEKGVQSKDWLDEFLKFLKVI